MNFSNQPQQPQPNPAYANDIRFQMYDASDRKRKYNDPDSKVKLQIPFHTVMELAAIVQSNQWQGDPIVKTDVQSGQPFFELRGGANINLKTDPYGQPQPLGPRDPHTKGYVKPAGESRNRTIAAQRARDSHNQGGQPSPAQGQWNRDPHQFFPADAPTPQPWTAQPPQQAAPQQQPPAAPPATAPTWGQQQPPAAPPATAPTWFQQQPPATPPASAPATNPWPPAGQGQ